jgi:DNA mismatch repair protein MutL
MGCIHRLPSELANQIAAGEVVERPASVVKELIENAIDAGARRVTIGIELGGKKRIVVEDDGVGMEGEDARLALERHATSKIAGPADLAAITTLGFRGEALPAIGSVSHLRLRTRARGATGGVEILVDGGNVGPARAVGAPEGTLVDVADLFRNLPARRKFLKSDAAEAAQISRVVTQFALGYPWIGFVLTSAGRRLLACPPVEGLADRFFQVYGERPDLVPLGKEAAGIRVAGYVAALAEQGPVRGPQNVFVNGRIVRDRTIAHAIQEAYSVATIKERSPEVHLFIEIPPDRVDVNVHPTKAEVRFLESSLVHEVLRRALADALGRGPARPLTLQPVEWISAPPRSPLLPGVVDHSAASRWAPATAPFAAQEPVDQAVAAATGTAVMTGDALPAPSQLAGGAASLVQPMVPLGQFRDTFIIAVDADSVSVVDQHVAHERVLFEQVMARLASGPLESQRLLQPVVIDLSPAERQALAAHAADLRRLGFEVEEFGGASVAIMAVPALLTAEAAVSAVRALAQDLEGVDRGRAAAGALGRIAATTACHAAVKANDRLTLEKMQYILDELRRTAYSSVCPHGRPVVLRLSRREIEKNFQRI